MINSIQSKALATLISLVFVFIIFIPLVDLLPIFSMWIFFPIIFLFDYFQIDYSPLFIQTLGHILLFLLVVFLYRKSFKKDLAQNIFRKKTLTLFYIGLFFCIHQLYYFFWCYIRGGRYDANDFIGVVFTTFESSVIFLIFGIVIDSFKNKNKNVKTTW